MCILFARVCNNYSIALEYESLTKSVLNWGCRHCDVTLIIIVT